MTLCAAYIGNPNTVMVFETPPVNWPGLSGIVWLLSRGSALRVLALVPAHQSMQRARNKINSVEKQMKTLSIFYTT